MMKKNGFTLAEVLITLSIIGVVATMTLPALMTNTQEQQAKTGLKKAVNTMTEMVQMHESLEGINYAQLTGVNTLAEINKDTNAEGTVVNPVNSFVGMIRDRAKVDVKKTLAATADGADKISTLASLNLPDVVYFADGTALLFNATDIVSDTTNTAQQEDGLPLGVTIVYDTNGSKGPNALSNCVTGGGTALGADDNTTDVTVCDTKKNRMINDQFQLQLRKNVVEPRGAAANWAFNN